MNDFRPILLGAALVVSAFGIAACTSNVDEPSRSTGDAVSSASAAPSRAAYIQTAPLDGTPVREPSWAHEGSLAAAPSALAANTCAETSDASGICSLASGRVHLFECSQAKVPPRQGTECKSAGGKNHWCCF
jgi:hypothetical protein